jgi:hypothetical protein
MTDSPKKITRRRPTRYPRQVVIMATEETYQALKAEAAEATEATGQKVSASTIARRWLDAGRAVTEAAQAAVDD